MDIVHLEELKPEVAAPDERHARAVKAKVGQALEAEMRLIPGDARFQVSDGNANMAEVVKAV